MPQTPGPAIIRIARAEDLPAIRAIVDAAYRPYVARMGREPGPMGEDYAALVAGGHVHVLEHDGAVAGLLVLELREHSMLLDNIAVHPAAQGRGHGAALMAFAEAATRRAGRDAITLYTHEMMTENQAIYARAGYRETHRAVEHGFARVYMRKSLAR